MGFDPYRKLILLTTGQRASVLLYHRATLDEISGIRELAGEDQSIPTTFCTHSLDSVVTDGQKKPT